MAAASSIFPIPCRWQALATASRPSLMPDTARGSFLASAGERDSDLIWQRLREKNPTIGFGSDASSSTRTNVREIPRPACCRAVCLRNRFSGSLPQSNRSLSCDFASSSILRTHRAFERFYRVLETLVGFGRIVQQGQHLPGVFL